MKENKYDDKSFFERYSRFPRSRQGLSAAGEWPEFKKLLPDFAGKRVLDIGCGFGWHCVYAAEHGAKRVIGTDISAKMLQTARARTSSPVIEYQQTAMEDLQFPPGDFDVVISSLAFHYTPHFSSICRKAHHFLISGGLFVFSVEHPVFTAHGQQDWAYNGDGSRAHWPVDNYFTEGKRRAVFLGEEVIKYHRMLTTYLDTLLQCGFSITAIVEPRPAGPLLDTVAGMRDELRRPMMLLVRAVKN